MLRVQVPLEVFMTVLSFVLYFGSPVWSLVSLVTPVYEFTWSLQLCFSFGSSVGIEHLPSITGYLRQCVCVALYESWILDIRVHVRHHVECFLGCAVSVMTTVCLIHSAMGNVVLYPDLHPQLIGISEFLNAVIWLALLYICWVSTTKIC